MKADEWQGRRTGIGTAERSLNGVQAWLQPRRDFLLDTLALRYKTERLIKEQTHPLQNEGGN